MTKHKDQMRAEFEAWATNDFYSGLTDLEGEWDDARGCYKGITHHLAYKAWQAARASAPTGIMEDGQWNIEGANTGEIEAYEHGVRTTMSSIQRVLDGDSEMGPLSSPMRDYRALMDEVRALKASAPQGAPTAATKEMMRAAVVYANGADIYDKVPLPALEIEESIYGEAYAAMLAAAPQPVACTCPSGDGSLRWPCPAHPPEQKGQT